MKLKEKSTPINVPETLKGFIKKGKEILWDRCGEFYSEPNVLLYYLRQNDEFMQDYNDYCIDKGKVNSLLIEELERTKEILDYYERISLRILV